MSCMVGLMLIIDTFNKNNWPGEVIYHYQHYRRSKLEELVLMTVEYCTL